MAPEADVASLCARVMWPLVCPLQDTCSRAWRSAQHGRHTRARVVFDPGMGFMAAASAVLASGFPWVPTSALACVQSHCIAGFMGLFGSECRGETWVEAAPPSPV